MQKVLDKIEDKRKSKNPFWFMLVRIKDGLWITSEFLKFHGILIYQSKKIKNLDKKEVKKYLKISFCTTCMNRLHHIQKTLKRNIENNIDYPDVEFILLDYNSQDNLKEWAFKNLKEHIDSGVLKYYQTKKPKKFHMSHAKNLAHNLATGEVVCNLDADNYAGKNFAYYINQIINFDEERIGCYKDYEKSFLKVNSNDVGGRIFLLKKHFKELGGYDERFEGWGLEDNDFYNRAKRLGLKRILIPLHFLKSIKHEDSERTINTNFKDPKTSELQNKKILEENNKNKIIFVDNKKLKKEEN